jgi:hypothetical protein
MGTLNIHYAGSGRMRQSTTRYTQQIGLHESKNEPLVKEIQGIEVVVE